MIQKHVDVLIIGAGPAGCVSAAYLNKQDLTIQVIEKSVFPRFVIGESLLPRSMEHFKEVGLFDCLDKQHFEKKFGARFIRNEEHCHFNFSKKYTPGWNWTWQVPRADFDHVLAQEIVKKGVPVAFNWAVTDVKFDDQGATATIENEQGMTEEIRAKFIIDSSGYGRVLPRLLGLDKPSERPSFSSIFTHVEDVRKPAGEEGSLITFDIVKQKVWLWVIPFSNGTTSLGFVGPTSFFEQYEGTTEERMQELLKLSSHYHARFDNLPFKFTPIQIQNYTKNVTQLYGNKYVLTGNSSSFIDPVFSSGVAFATESSLLAAKLVCKELAGEKVDWEVEYARYIQKGVSVFESYVNEWYTGNLQKLFFHRPENPDIKSKICAVLAGYVWDESNPFVKKHHRVIKSMAHLIDLEKEQHRTS
ncbi:tryptophan 7-halogenase [Flavobacteriaceae bacterium F08102]|nr:tryptophan 7-halogenase [Flavobacteriaceae bacterium F08102]